MKEFFPKDTAALPRWRKSNTKGIYKRQIATVKRKRRSCPFERQPFVRAKDEGLTLEIITMVQFDHHKLNLLVWLTLLSPSFIYLYIVVIIIIIIIIIMIMIMIMIIIIEMDSSEG